jgi:hypothetical protein
MRYEIVMDYKECFFFFFFFFFWARSQLEHYGATPVTLSRSVTQVRSKGLLSSTELAVVDRQTDV